MAAAGNLPADHSVEHGIEISKPLAVDRPEMPGVDQIVDNLLRVQRTEIVIIGMNSLRAVPFRHVRQCVIGFAFSGSCQTNTQPKRSSTGQARSLAAGGIAPS